MKPKHTLQMSLAASAAVAAVGWALLHYAPVESERAIDVYPGGDIQKALDETARQGGRLVRVHAGTYRPSRPADALVHFYARHDGIVVEAVGRVTLTAANPGVADRHAPSYPAIVSHVVYFGDHISRKTVLRGFRIEGANGYVRGPPGLRPIEAAKDLERADHYLTQDKSADEGGENLPRTHYYFTDGGGILVYGRSFPTIEDVEIADNYSAVCGAGLSVQHHLVDGFQDSVLCRHCVFRNNRTGVSGSATDLLSAGSFAVFENCLFVRNVSNVRIDVNRRSGYGALTVFPRCRAIVRRCTFTENNAGVDDRGSGSSYTDCIFWNNRRPGGVNTRPRFELDITDAAGVRGCFIHGQVNDLRDNVSVAVNTFDPPDPAFDGEFRPKNPRYAEVGYRPVQDHQ